MKPKKPFMISRADDSEYASIVGASIKWDDWDGDHFATKADAQATIDNLPALHDCKVIEVLDEIRARF